jgi:hypothetical protein
MKKYTITATQNGEGFNIFHTAEEINRLEMLGILELAKQAVLTEILSEKQPITRPTSPE